jgi:kynureninase
VLSTAPLIASLDLFREAGMANLRAKSLQLTRYLVELLQRAAGEHVKMVTPSSEEQRGCQISFRVVGSPQRGRRVFDALQDKNVICDWREPDIIRVAPAPLYNTFVDVYQFAARLAASVREIP